ncbi:MAG: hypothetical protein WCK06_03475 [Actinomycetota bacterium]
MSAAAVVAVMALGVSACGGTTSQDASEEASSYPVEITKVSFPPRQDLAQPTFFTIVVRNSGEQSIPNIAVTILNADTKTQGVAEAFGYSTQQDGVADRSRPLFVIDQQPTAGQTAYVNTWAMGELAPGASQTFTWKVTATRAGVFAIKYQVAPDLNGKAKAKLADGGVAQGTVTVRVLKAAPNTTVGPDGEVIRSHKPPQ